MNKGLLAIWTDIAPELEEDFNNWYNHEHLAERSGIPGFINGRRYQALAGESKYLALYDTESVAVLYGADYRNRLDNPTPWTQRIIANFQNVTRLTAAVHTRLGNGCGGVVATIRLQSDEQQHQSLASWLSEQILPEILELTGVVGAYLAIADDSEASDETAEGQLRKAWEQGSLWSVIVEANSESAARAGVQYLSESALMQHGAKAAIRIDYYQLFYVLGRF